MKATPDEMRAEKARELRSYLGGFALAVALTAIPFALVASGAASLRTLAWAIGVCALAQVVVHRRPAQTGPGQPPRPALPVLGLRTLGRFRGCGGARILLGRLVSGSTRAGTTPPAHRVGLGPGPHEGLTLRGVAADLRGG